MNDTKTQKTPTSDGGILLTGATGFVGGEILARLIERGDRPIYALIRTTSQSEADARLRRTLISLRGRGSLPAGLVVEAVPADLTRPGLALTPDRRRRLADRTAQVIHCAASVSFTLGLAESRAINVAGTSRLLDLASIGAMSGRLECFTHVSTAYVAGDHRGTYAERDFDLGQEFRNPYEGTKFEAEGLVRRRGASMPVQILRPSIVVGDSRTGWTPAFNVLYGPLRAFARGAYPAIPADTSAPVDAVPVDYVADATLALAGRPGTTYHLTAGERASSVGELIELACAHLGRPAPRIVPPRLYRRAVHPLLVRTASPARRRALRRSEAYFPYFSVGARFDDREAREALAPAGIEAPRLDSYFPRLMEFAAAAGWGRQPVERRDAARATAAAREPVAA